MPLQRLRPVTGPQLERLFQQLEAANTHFDRDARKGALNALQAVVDFIAANSPANEHLERPILKVLSRMRGIDPQRVQPGDVLPPDGGDSGGVKRRGDEQRLRANAAFAMDFLERELGRSQAYAAETVVALLNRANIPFAKKASNKAAAVKRWLYGCRGHTDRGAAAIFDSLRADPPVPKGRDIDKREVALFIWFDGELRRMGYSPPGAEWLPTAKDFVGS